jgi:hypothetical protein
MGSLVAHQGSLHASNQWWSITVPAFTTVISRHRAALLLWKNGNKINK